MRPIKKAARTFSDMDKVLFFTSLILIVFGSLNIVTASSRAAVINYDVSIYYYFYRQLAFVIVGLIAGIILLKIDTKYYKIIIYPLFIKISSE